MLEPVGSGWSSDSLELVVGEMTSGEKYSDEWVEPTGEINAVAVGCVGGGTSNGEDWVIDCGSWNRTVIVKPSVSYQTIEAIIRWIQKPIWISTYCGSMCRMQMNCVAGAICPCRAWISMTGSRQMLLNK